MIRVVTTFPPTSTKGYYIAEGLKGAGDRDEDGYIDVDESTYVADNVKSWAKPQGYKQTPRKQMNVTGSILIGYHPEVQEKIKAAQEEFNAYQKKLRAITELDLKEEVTPAEKLLERQMVMREPLTADEGEWADLIRDLADGKMTIAVYRRAIRGFDVMPEVDGPLSETPTPQTDTPSPAPNGGGGSGIIYAVGGGIAAVGGALVWLLSRGDDDDDDTGAQTDDDDDDDDDDWPTSDMPLPPPLPAQ